MLGDSLKLNQIRRIAISIVSVTFLLCQQLLVYKRDNLHGVVQYVELHQRRNNNTTPLLGRNSTLALQSIGVKISKFKKGKLVLYSALATNSSENAAWDIIVAQGWIREKKKLSFGCCIIHESGYIVNYKGTSRATWSWFGFVKYGAIQFRCNISGNHSKFGAPSKVAIYPIGAVVDLFCARNLNHYVDIDLTYKQNGIVVFLKVLYNNLSYLDLLAWFEIHRSLGVNKVLGYVADNLNKKAKIVLGHYQRMGLFEALHYPIPYKSKESLFTGASRSSWNYRGVSMFDGQIRLRGYEYLISMDPDEYLIPTHSKESFRDVFDRMFGKHRNAAGFTFKTYFYIKDWGGEGNSSYSVEKYQIRSTGTRDRVKHVVIPNRVEIGGLKTHSLEPATKYKSYVANTSDIALYHYRVCRPEWVKNAKCDKMPKIRDTRIYKRFKSLEGRIARIRSIYGL